MNLLEALRVSWGAIQANKLRSFLTMLGVIIGVAAVIAMVSVGQGASAMVTQRINSLGTNLLIVMPGAANVGGISQGQGSVNALTLSDVTAIQQKASAVAEAAPNARRPVQVVWRGNNAATTAEGTTPAFTSIRDWPVQYGRFFNQLEVDASARVVVLGTTVVQELFGSASADPVGRTVLINGMPFSVIGVMTSKGNQGFANADDVVILPVTTLMHRLFDFKYVGGIFVSAKSTQDMNLATSQIDNILHYQHNLPPTAPNDFTVQNQQNIMSMAQGVTSTLTFLLGGIAAISLLVGGIGIMNIMLVSVTERTREIGIRKAIGARRADVMTQFLIEAVMLSLMGGVLGVAGGVALSHLVARIGHLPSVVSPLAIAVAFGFAALIGIVFGVFPAFKASRQSPIEALRYE
jgi:putative ABC transport system permease protein